MKTLLILRHAKSSWKHAELPDHDRPLKKRGKRDAPRMGRLARDQNLTPDLIISSTAVRALRTAELFAEHADYQGDLQRTRDLYGAGPAEFRSVVAQVSDDHATVMVVAHNPGLEELVEELTGSDALMPTAALAVVQLPIERWSEWTPEVSGRLLNLWRPRELG